MCPSPVRFRVYLGKELSDSGESDHYQNYYALRQFDPACVVTRGTSQHSTQPVAGADGRLTERFRIVRSATRLTITLGYRQMKPGDKIRVFKYTMGFRTGTKDLVVEKFRYCLGVFASSENRLAENFTPLCDLFEPGPDSKQKYIPNHGEYHTNMVQAWMDLP